MARYIGPKCKICRRMGEKLFLRGDKCLSDKCVFQRRGEEEAKSGFGRKKLSPYSLQLKEKQKLKAIYGISENQLYLFYERAAQAKGDTVVNLLSALERRLDNVVFRLGFANSRAEARQLIRHGHIAVNDRKIDIPSYLVETNQIIRVRTNKGTKIVKQVLAGKEGPSANWLTLDKNNAVGRVIDLPTIDDLKAVPVNTQAIVELYSK